MSINTTASSVSASAAPQVSNIQTAETSQKTSSDKSFKDEMEKVSSKQESDSKNNVETSEKENKTEVKASSSQKEKIEDIKISDETNIENLKFASLSMNTVNSQLSGDIAQMMNSIGTVENDIFGFSKDIDFTNSISLTESDAEFFINLVQNETVDTQAVVAQAQTLLNSGAEISEVKQNVQISQTLLDAIAKAKENNQPLRIDFDKDIAVILRIGKDGAISANFIPGDKVVEQYLKNNLSSLKAVFDEAELPYSDLSYSNRGSKQQKEHRRENKEG